MQDKIDCNNIKEIREERNAILIYTGSTISGAYIQSSSNPLEIFTNFVKNPFTTSEHPRNPFPLCSGNSQFRRQTISWLQLTFWEEQKDFSPLEWIIQIEVSRWTLNRFASVCPRVVERAFDKEVLLEYLSCFLKSDTHICRPFVPFQKGLKRYVFSKRFFWNFTLVIDYKHLVIDYTVIFWRVMTFEFEFQEFRCW